MMPNARPIEIQIVDSIAASLIVITWAVLCTASRSKTSIAVIAPMRATHAQSGTSKLAKSSCAVSAAAVEAGGQGCGQRVSIRDPR